MKTLFRLLLMVFISMCSTLAFSQAKKSVTGAVADSAGNPLPGVTIKVKGTKTTTVSDAQGNFTIPLPSDNGTLEFSSIGYLDKQVEVTAGTPASVALVSNAKQLNEVVVTGFGARTNTRKLSYATQEIKSAELKTAPSPNVLNSLQGKLAGVRIDQGTGGAGSSSRIRIRGNTSLQGNQSPLFVIDGVLIKPGISGPETWSDNNNVDFGNILKNINEDDIESIDLPGYTIDATVTQDPSGKPAVVDATVKGPYYGIRGAGLCLVYRF